MWREDSLFYFLKLMMRWENLIYICASSTFNVIQCFQEQKLCFFYFSYSLRLCLSTQIIVQNNDGDITQHSYCTLQWFSILYTSLGLCIWRQAASMPHLKGVDSQALLSSRNSHLCGLWPLQWLYLVCPSKDFVPKIHTSKNFLRCIMLL